MSKLNIARMIYIGMDKLGFKEKQMFRMTPRKFFILYNEMLIVNGYKKEEDECAIDALP